MSIEQQNIVAIDLNAASPKTRGRRLAIARELTGLTRIAFAEKYHFNPFTYKGWENGKHGGLTEKKAEAIILMLQSEGVTCHFEWLMHGLGETPKITKQIEPIKENYTGSILQKNPLNFTEDEKIAYELFIFHACYRDTVDWIVADDGMEPTYQKGDIVAGIKVYGKDIIKTYGQACIIQTKSGANLLRQLQKGKNKNYYTLLCINLKTQQEVVLPDVEVISAASVIWHRKKANK